MPGVWSWCRWAGQKKHRMQKRPYYDCRALCHSIDLCYFDLGCGFDEEALLGTVQTTLWATVASIGMIRCITFPVLSRHVLGAPGLQPDTAHVWSAVSGC